MNDFARARKLQRRTDNNNEECITVDVSITMERERERPKPLRRSEAKNQNIQLINNDRVPLDVAAALSRVNEPHN